MNGLEMLLQILAYGSGAFVLGVILAAAVGLIE